MSYPVVSLLMPTRSRTKMMQETVATYLEKATVPDHVEVIVRVHEDDLETVEWASKRDKRIRVVIGDTEKGYGSMDHFCNCMAAVSNGNWLWPAADDHQMLSQGWDEVLAQWPVDPRRTPMLLTAKVANWPDGRIPVMSRGLYSVLGHMGHTQFADCYMDSLTHFAGIKHVSGLEVRDVGLGDVVPRRVMEGWAIYKGVENCWCFEMDKKKLGAVLGKSLGNWTPEQAPALP